MRTKRESEKVMRCKKKYAIVWMRLKETERQRERECVCVRER